MSLARATRSELTKQFSTSLWWVLAIVLVAYLGFTAGGLAATLGAVASGVLSDSATGGALPGETLPPIIYSIATSVGYIFPLLIGVLVVTGEFRHKTLTPTFLATPRRGIALTGKALAGVVMGVLYGVLALVATVGPGAGLLAAFGEPTALDEPETWALLGRIVVAFVVWVLIGIGVGTLVRNQIGAVVGVIAFTQFVEPIVRTVAGFIGGVGDVIRFLPGAASDALVGASIYSTFAEAAGGAAPLDWWAGGLILLGYAVVFLVLGGLLSWRRDVA